MALTDGQKLGAVKMAIINRIEQFDDWTVFKLFLQGITKDQIKAFIIARLDEIQTSKENAILLYQQELIDFGDLETEIDTDM